MRYLRVVQGIAVTGFALTKEDILLFLNVAVLVLGLVIDYLDKRDID